jgi:hypothetical protein
MSKIDRILIFTMKKDLRLTRICVASIRHFYPQIRIDLVKDESRGRFSTADIESAWGCGVERFGKEFAGGSGMLIKLEPLFLPGNERVLLLDSDTVFVGRALDAIEQSSADFVVTEDVSQGDLSTPYGRKIVALYLFDLEKLLALETGYVFPEKMFNCGHIVIHTGAISRELVSRYVEKGTAPRFRHNGIFQMGDQGFYNFLLHRLAQMGTARLQHVPFAVYPADLPECDVRSVLDRTLPFGLIAHWAGQHHKSRLSAMQRSDLLLCFERLYYSKLRFGRIQAFSSAFRFWARYWLAAARHTLLRGILRR